MRAKPDTDECRVVVEPSGYTRPKGAHSAVELQGGYTYKINTDINPQQLALRKLLEPLEYQDPYSHKNGPNRPRAR